MEYEGMIRGYPEEVVKRMLDIQKEQYGKSDLRKLEYSGAKGSFIFNKTVEGQTFWMNIIRTNDFDPFFQRYPKPIDISKAIDEVSEIVKSL